MTIQEIAALRVEAINTIYSDASNALQLLCAVTALEDKLVRAGHRPIYPPQPPLKPRVELGPIIRATGPPRPLRDKKDEIKKFDPQMKLFNF